MLEYLHKHLNENLSEEHLYQVATAISEQVNDIFTLCRGMAQWHTFFAYGKNSMMRYGVQK